MNPEFPDIERPDRPLQLAGVAVIGILAGPFVGATTNAINGLVSREYFVNILQWHDVADVWRASIARGIFEGLAIGFCLAVFFTIATAIITRVSCTFGFAFKHLAGIVAGAYGCWVLGGAAAMGLAALSPEFYRGAVFGVPHGFGDMLAYAWVGGSIVGVEWGGILCLILGLVFLRANWRRQLRGHAS
jgi:hypothetical protein